MAVFRVFVLFFFGLLASFLYIMCIHTFSATNAVIICLFKIKWWREFWNGSSRRVSWY